MEKKRIVTEGGGQNLYEKVGSEVYKVNVSPIPFGDSKVKIGTAEKMEDALSLIKHHSGKEIKIIK